MAREKSFLDSPRQGATVKPVLKNVTESLLRGWMLWPGVAFRFGRKGRSH